MAAVAAVIVTIVGGANCVDHVLAVARNLKSNNFKYTTNFLTEILLLENRSQLVNYRCSNIQPSAMAHAIDYIKNTLSLHSNEVFFNFLFKTTHYKDG